ncbi:MAG: SMC family ATPase [Thermoproteales archaeon]|nr:SMC family ATPase [Thermoproteales archaeon]
MSSRTLKEGLKLESIKIEGFRAFNSPRELKFGDKVTVFLGPVGSGKTSLLKAIEFCLFGNVSEVVERAIKQEDLINDFRDRVLVSLKLVGEGGNKVEVTRIKERGKRTKLRLYINGKPFDKGDPEEFIKDLLGLNLMEFARGVYVKWDVLRDLIIGSPSSRSKALDKLFGIEVLEEIYSAISLKTIERKLKEKEDEVNMLLKQVLPDDKIGDLKLERDEAIKKIENIKTRLSEIHSEIESLSKKLVEMQALQDEYNQLIQERAFLQAREESLSKSLQSIPSPGDIIEISYLLRELKKEAIKLLSALIVGREVESLKKIPETDVRKLIPALKNTVKILETRLEDLEKEITKISNEVITYQNILRRIHENIGSLTERLEPLRTYRDELFFLNKKYGSLREIDNSLHEMKLELSELQVLRREKREALNLLKATIRKIREKGETRCPICGRVLNTQHLKELETLLDNLLKEKGDILIKRVSELESRINELQKIRDRIVFLEEKIGNLSGLEHELKELKEEAKRIGNLATRGEELLKELQTKRNQISSFTKKARRIMERIEPLLAAQDRKKELENIRKRLKEVEAELEELGYNPRLIDEVRNRLSELRVEMASLNTAKKYIERRLNELETILARHEKILGIVDSEEKRIRTYKQLYEKMRLVRYSFRAIQSELRKRVLQRVVEKANEIFKQIYVYPDYAEINVKVVRRVSEEGAIRSIYEIFVKRSVDESWVPMDTRLSDGQKTIIAFSMILSLRELSPCRLKVLLLDEPLLNVDEECRKAWVNMLGKSNMNFQLIVSTQDRRLVEELIKEYGSDIVVYELKHNGIEGPIVVQRKIVDSNNSR